MRSLRYLLLLLSLLPGPVPLSRADQCAHHKLSCVSSVATCCADGDPFWGEECKRWGSFTMTICYCPDCGYQSISRSKCR